MKVKPCTQRHSQSLTPLGSSSIKSGFIRKTPKSMASIALRHKSRHLILKSHHTLFNLSRLYSYSSYSDNDDDDDCHRQQSSNPAQINEEILKNFSPNNRNPNANPNSDINYLMVDTFRESMQKLKEQEVDNNVNQQFTLTNYLESLSTNNSMGNTNPNRRRVTGRSLELRNELEESRPEVLGKFKEKETENSATEMGGLNFEELRKSIDSIRLKLKDDPPRR